MCLNCGAPYVVRNLKTGEVIETNMQLGPPGTGKGYIAREANNNKEDA